MRHAVYLLRNLLIFWVYLQDLQDDVNRKPGKTGIFSRIFKKILYWTYKMK